jgi:hypothetical protein
MTVWRVENGKTRIPSDRLKVWARALRVKAVELLA